MLTGGGGKICQNLADVICERSLFDFAKILTTYTYRYSYRYFFLKEFVNCTTLLRLG